MSRPIANDRRGSLELGPVSGLAAALVLTVLLAFAPSATATPGTIFYTVGSPEPHVAQLWSVRDDGGRARLLRRRMPVGPEGGVARLSRDGKRIFCICVGGEIDSVRTDGTHLRRLDGLPRGTRFDVVALSSTGWAFWVNGGRRILGQKPGGKPRLITKLDGAVIDERVIPSPDGHRLAFVAYGCPAASCATDEVESVLTTRLDGTDRTLVYQGSGIGKEIYDVAWAPDGSRLIFSDGTGGDSDPKGELPVSYPQQWFLAPSDGSDPAGTVVPLPEQTSYPMFSPEGTRLAFTGRGGSRLLLTIAGLDGAEPRLLPGTGCRSYCEFAPRAVSWTQG